MSKTQRLLLNLLQILFIVAAVLAWGHSLTLHALAGICFTFLSVWHLRLNRKMFVSIGKFFRAGVKNTKLKWQFQISILATSFWSIAIISGLLGLIAVFYTGDVEQAAFVHVHGVLARVGCVMVLIHIIQHHKHIAAYLAAGKV